MMLLSQGDLKWVRKILYTYWLVILIHLIGQCIVILFMKPVFVSVFISRNIIFPTLSMSAFMLSAELMYRKNYKYLLEYIVILGAYFGGLAVITCFDVRIMPAVFLLNIVTIVLFFNRKIILLSSIAQFLTYIIVYAISPLFRKQLLDYDILSTIFLMFLSTVIAFNIAVRGKEILHELEKSIHDKQELHIRNEVAAQMARTDYLTQLNNRIAFDERFDKALNSENTEFSLSMIDIDNFKSINDTYGHSVGDMVLVNVSAVLRENCKDTDFIARYGGEEFAVLSFDGSYEEHIEKMDSIRRKISAATIPELPGRSVTISAGIKRFVPNESKREFLANTDALLYEAKRTGKNKVVSILGSISH